MSKHGEHVQYEQRTRVASVPVTNSSRNFMVINRIKPIGKDLPNSIDIRRFYTCSHHGSMRPTGKGIHIKLDMIENVLAGIWEALTPDERRRCMAGLKKGTAEEGGNG